MSITYTNGSDKIKNGSGTAVCRAQLGWEKTAETNTSVTYSCKVYIYCIRYGYSTSGTLSASLDATGREAYAATGGSCDIDPGERKQLMSHSYTFTKTTSSQAKTISFSVTANGTSVSGKSSGTQSIIVPARTSYSISYNGNGATSGSMSAQTKYYGESLTLRSNAFSRTGYNFSKFNTKANGTGTDYLPGRTYTANAKATLYAQWTPQTHTITYYGNGATGGSTYTQTKTYGQTATLYNNFTRTGYSITGWNTTANGSGTAYSTTQVLSATFNSNLTLYAQWKLNYTKATISNLIVQRVRTNDTTADDCRTEFDQGTILYVSFHCKTGSSDGTTWTDPLTCHIAIDGVSAYPTTTLNLDNNGEKDFEEWFLNSPTGYNTEQPHTVVITLTSNSQSVSKTITVSPSTFPIDLVVNNDDVYMGVMHPAQTGIPLITAPLKVDGNITTTGGITTTGNITVGNNKITLNSTSGNITTTGGITVSGNLTIGGNQTITIGSGTAISGTISGNLNITGQYRRNGNTYIITDSIPITSSTNIPGTSSSSDSYKSITATAAKDGYTLIGVTSYNIQNADSGGANSSHVMCYGTYIDTSANTVTIKVRNLASSAAVVKINVRCLYRAN